MFQIQVCPLVPYCRRERWGQWQHGETISGIFVPLAFLMGQKEAESSVWATHLTHPSPQMWYWHCSPISLSVLGQCLGYILSFLITKCGFIIYEPVVPFWSFSMFSDWTAPPGWEFHNPFLFSESLSYSILNTWGLLASLPTASMAS